jgi:hypothetical protein
MTAHTVPLDKEIPFVESILELVPSAVCLRFHSYMPPLFHNFGHDVQILPGVFPDRSDDCRQSTFQSCWRRSDSLLSLGYYETGGQSQLLRSVTEIILV